MPPTPQNEPGRSAGLTVSTSTDAFRTVGSGSEHSRRTTLESHPKIQELDSVYCHAANVSLCGSTIRSMQRDTPQYGGRCAEKEHTTPRCIREALWARSHVSPHSHIQTQVHSYVPLHNIHNHTHIHIHTNTHTTVVPHNGGRCAETLPA